MVPFCSFPVPPVLKESVERVVPILEQPCRWGRVQEQNVHVDEGAFMCQSA